MNTGTEFLHHRTATCFHAKGHELRADVETGIKKEGMGRTIHENSRIRQQRKGVRPQLGGRGLRLEQGRSFSIDTCDTVLLFIAQNGKNS